MDMFEIIARVGEEIDVTYSGIATDGTTLAIVDTEFVMPAGTFDGGSYVMLTGDNAGKYGSIQSQSEGTITFTKAIDVSQAVEAGDTYLLISGSKYKLEHILQAINLEISQYKIPYVDDTLVVDLDVNSYDLPEGVNPGNLMKVYVATNSTAPFDYTPVEDWEIKDSKLYFVSGLSWSDEGKNIRLECVVSHGLPVEGEIDTNVDFDALVWRSVHRLIKNQYRKVGKDNPNITDFLQDAQSRMMRANIKAERANPLPKKRIRLTRWD